MIPLIIDIVVRIAAAALPAVGFGTFNLIVPQATNSLNGARFAYYASTTEAAAALTSGYISSGVNDIIVDLFSQPGVQRVALTRVDLVGVETYATALNAAILAGAQFYGVGVLSIVDQVNEDVGVAVLAHAKPMIFFAQTASADLLTSGFPAGMADIAGSGRVALVYHDQATYAVAPLAASWAANRLAFDADVQAPGWTCGVKSIASYAAALTDAQKGFIVANKANFAGPLGTETMWMHPAQLLDANSVEIRFTGDWLGVRLGEDLQNLMTREASAGRKIPGNDQGLDQIQGIIEARFQRGVDALHVAPGQFRVTSRSYNATTRKATFAFQAQALEGIIGFNVTVDLQNTPIFS